MFIPTPCHGTSIDCLRTALRRAAEAQARQQATVAPPATCTPRPSGAEWPRKRTRLAPAIASVLISIGLLGSVVLGMTSMAGSDAATMAAQSQPVGTV